MTLGCCAPRTHCKQSFAIDAESAGTITLVSADAASGYTIVIRSAYIQQDATTGAAIVLKAGASTILSCNVVTYSGELTDYTVNGEAITAVITGAGTASGSVSVEFM